MRRVFILALVMLAMIADAAERKHPPTQQDLDEITQRGKTLYEYDQAAWHGTDAVLATDPDKSRMGKFIACRRDDGWHLGFGKLNEDGSRFLLAYEAIQNTQLKEYKVVKYDPVQETEGFYAVAGRAVDLTEKVLETPEKRRYNYAIVQTQNGQLYVYWLPAQTNLKRFPLGGDTRYLVSADGLKILETRQMHKSIIEADELPTGATLASGYNTAVLDDVPEDSDVFHVLTRKPLVPEYVASQKCFYVVQADGSIQYLGETKKVLKNK
jgi:hypothetical protein